MNVFRRHIFPICDICWMRNDKCPNIMYNMYGFVEAFKLVYSPTYCWGCEVYLGSIMYVSVQSYLVNLKCKSKKINICVNTYGLAYFQNWRANLLTHRCIIILNDNLLFLGGLHVTNLPIRLMCLTPVCPSTFSFLDSNSKMLCSIEFKLDMEIDHHHS